MDDLRVGTKLWARTCNRSHPEPIWSPYEILGETRISWLIGPLGAKPDQHWGVEKFKKRDFRVGPGHTYVLTEEHKAHVDWMNVHAGYSTGGRVQSLRDYETLKKIVDILDEYEERKRQERDGQREGR